MPQRSRRTEAVASRRDWGISLFAPSAATALGLFGLVGAAGAADPAKAGTKDDPAYQARLIWIIGNGKGRSGGELWKPTHIRWLI